MATGCGQGRTPLQVRIGINTGEVVVRSIQTSADHTEYTPIGHSTSLAARLQTLATPGSTVISGYTRGFVEGYFQLKALGPTRLKGVSEPVEVFEATGLGPLRTRLQRAAGRGLTKFVGREREMEALRHAAELARTGHGQLVAAMGEPGAGKSRLCHEFKLISQSAWMTLEAFSVSHGKATAYLPLLELLREYFRIITSDDPRTRREKVTGRVLALDRSLEDTLPYLFALLGQSEDDNQLSQMDAQIRRRRTHEAIKRILLRESLNQPLMLIVEDLHWIDGETQALLSLLIDAIANARILLLVNYRPEYRHEWGSRTHYTQLRLDPLGPDMAEEMLNALLLIPLARSFAREGKGEGAAAGEGDLTTLKRLIIERTEGNPFFMEETVQALLDDGALVRNRQVRLTRPLGDLKMPLTVQAMLSARIDRLPAPEKELLQTLAVIGKELALELIKGVTAKREEELEAMLTNLQLGEFIYEQPSIAGPEYTFKHALTQEVAYNSLLAERRRLLHEQTAREIEQLYAQQLDDHWSELAHHYLRGIDAAKAVHYARLAAEQAVSRSAYPEAASIAEAALKLLDKIPDSAERFRAELALRNIESNLTFATLGPNSPERERVLRRMCELGEKIGGGDSLLHGLQALANLYLNLGESRRGLATAKRAAQVAEATEDPGLLASVHYLVGFLAFSCGNLREAVAHFKDALRHMERTNRNFFVGPYLGWSTVPCVLATVMHLLGSIGEAVRLAEEGLKRARESGHLFSLAFALMLGEVLRCYRREAEVVHGHADEAIPLCNEIGSATWLAYARVYEGWALAELGQLERGVAEMEAGIVAIPLGGALLQDKKALLGQGYGRLGRTDEALTILDQALARIEHTGEVFAHAETLRLKGEVLLIHDAAATAEAERCFRAALEVARAQEAKWWELRSSVSLARLLRETNRSDEARTVLGGIYGWFTQGFDLLDLKEAKTLLDDL
jgi:predicted ATPase